MAGQKQGSARVTAVPVVVVNCPPLSGVGAGVVVIYNFIFI